MAARLELVRAPRGRSIVILHMIAEIDRFSPLKFCHVSYLDPGSIEYRARIVRLLGLTDVREPEADKTGILPGDEDHCEEIRSSFWGGGTITTITHLNKSVAGFACWIGAAYHAPYSVDPRTRLAQEGKIIRVDPLNGWARNDNHAYL